MLFQPTNITPDMLGRTGNGTVDPTADFSVSWQVNGNSPMVAFQIDIYPNTSTTIVTYSTGKLTTGCPFSGTNSLGVRQTFTYTGSSSFATLLGASSGEYKMIITQWWSNADSIEQSSPSVFNLKSAPTLTMTTPSVTTRDYTFTATYSQADGDVLNWVRWEIGLDKNGTGENIQVLYDSGNIYGTSELSCYYDGFFTGTNYAVMCTVETESGVQVTTDWVQFSVSYTMLDLGGTVTAQRMCNGKSAVNVIWDGYTYITGTPSSGAEYSFDNGLLNLLNGTITWDTVNGSPMSFAAPWNILFKTTITANSTSLLQINTSGHDLEFTYSLSNRRLTLTAGSNTYTWNNANPEDTISLIITPSKAYVRIDGLRGGLYPATTLYPADALYPSEDDVPTVYTYSTDIVYTQSAINGMTVSAEQSVWYIQEVSGALDQSVINSVWRDGDYEVYGIDGTNFMTNFANGGLNAGSLFFEGTEIIGWAIYREDLSTKLLKHITDVPVAVSSVLDYSARSQGGAYKYYIYPIGDTIYISDAMQSNQVAPCFWNWTILECETVGENKYSVLNEFTFGKNLSSGNITNSNSPSVMENFTAYPTVQLSPQNYKAGTLESLIGTVRNAQYSDTIELRDAILNLSVTMNPLFLKSRKGDLMQIRISGAISFAMMDNSKEQATSISIPWVEVADASNASIIG